MGSFWNQLFDESGFVPRKTCGAGWTPELIWLHIGSDLFIWLAYYQRKAASCFLRR